MQFGKYLFTPLAAASDRPMTNKQTGLVLLEVKGTGELHVIVATPLPLTLRTVFAGKVGSVLSARFGKNPIQYLNVYYWASGGYGSTKKDKDALNAIISHRLADLSIRNHLLRQEKDSVSGAHSGT